MDAGPTTVPAPKKGPLSSKFAQLYPELTEMNRELSMCSRSTEEYRTLFLRGGTHPIKHLWHILGWEYLYSYKDRGNLNTLFMKTSRDLKGGVIRLLMFYNWKMRIGSDTMG